MKKQKMFTRFFMTAIIATAIFPAIPSYAMVTKKDLDNYQKEEYQKINPRPRPNNFLNNTLPTGKGMYFLNTNHGDFFLGGNLTSFFSHNHAIAGQDHRVFYDLTDENFTGMVQQVINLLQANDLNRPLQLGKTVPSTDRPEIQIRLTRDNEGIEIREFFIEESLLTREMIRNIPGFRRLRAFQLLQNQHTGAQMVEFRLRIAITDQPIGRGRFITAVEPVPATGDRPILLTMLPNTPAQVIEEACGSRARNRTKRETERQECLVNYHTPYYLSLPSSRSIGVEKEERGILTKLIISGPLGLVIGEGGSIGWFGNKILDILFPLEERVHETEESPVFVKIEPVGEGGTGVRSGDKVRLYLKASEKKGAYLHQDGRLAGKKEQSGTIFALKLEEEGIAFVDEEGRNFSVDNQGHFSFVLPFKITSKPVKEDL